MQHDAQWYRHIVDYGYMLDYFPLETPGNTMAHVGFFPGYPTAGWLIKILTGFSTDLSLLLAAQIFTIGVWMYVLLFLDRFNVGWKLQSTAIITILALPSSFFFLSGYSESLFTFALLGYLFWMTSNHRYAPALAALHGFIMSATRIVGIPLLILPILREAFVQRKIPVNIKPYIVALCTGLGAAIFFLYCQANFGEWNIYSHAQSFGWGVTPKFSAVFDSATYKIELPGTSWDGFVDPDGVSRLSVPLIFVAALMVLLGELIVILRNPRDPSRIDHILLFAAAGCLFFITVSGLQTLKMRSVIRYMLPPFLLLVIMAASMLSEFKYWNTWAARCVWALYSIGIAIMFFVEAGHIDLFSHGIWVA
jgi:hypothetical protein